MELSAAMQDAIRYFGTDANYRERDRFMSLPSTGTCAALVRRGLLEPATSRLDHVLTDDGRGELYALDRPTS